MSFLWKKPAKDRCCGDLLPHPGSKEDIVPVNEPGCLTHLFLPKITSVAGTDSLRSDATSLSVCLLARLIIQRDQLVDIIKLWQGAAVC